MLGASPREIYMGIIDPAKRAERQSRRQTRRENIKSEITETIGEWRKDHKIDDDEKEDIRVVAGGVLRGAGLVGLDALDGQLTNASLSVLRDACVEFLTVLAVALED
jgi:hypothetical protein